MRRAAVLVAFAALISASFSCAIRGRRATVDVEHDEFTGATNMRAEAQMPPFGFTVALLTSSEAAPTIGGSMMFTRQNPSWRYLRCHRVDMLADGQRVELGESEHDGTIISGGVIEHVTVRLSPEALRTVATSSGIRVRVCDDAWSISPELMRAMRGIGRRLGYTRRAPEAVAPVIIGPAP